LFTDTFVLSKKEHKSEKPRASIQVIALSPKMLGTSQFQSHKTGKLTTRAVTHHIAIAITNIKRAAVHPMFVYL